MLTPEQVAPQIAAIRAVTPDNDVFASCLQASASVNRNACLDQIAVDDIAIMLDDDIEGFYPGWVGDLLVGLTIQNAVMVSARLLNPDGSFGPTCSRCHAREPMEIEVKSNGEAILPTAAIAFHNRGHVFDPVYVGSGFEDSDWCHQYLASDPNAVFVQSNRCKLIHANLMRGQKGDNWKNNRAHFERKWHVR